ncbi:MAG: hypothetical protein FRX48_01051 [Lasallia pustulata]|uniref:Uncharacterized protein n=1 Tax=Lasallia pustulata TaxID=136370 RepID=A0A5M8Q5Q8_9LECA|nr:MAG: hypothetical protein FRX48_01051 [Lasallia pustulata]
MRTAVLVSALIGLAAAAPRPQDIEFDVVDTAATITEQGPAVTAVSQVISNDPVAAASTVYAAVLADPTDVTPTTTERSLEERGVDVSAPCAVQPDGYGPKTTPDTVADFMANPLYDQIASAAPVPQGYNLVFASLNGSCNANTYLGLTTLQSYDTIKCQQLCDTAPLCTAFNIYMERDPSVNPNATMGCPNPPSIVNYKCTLWGAGVTVQSASNTGQWRTQFQVAIRGSNGYVKNAPPPAQTNFTGPVEFGGAINAPSSYMGVKYFSGPYDVFQCAAACQANTAYDHRHPKSDGSYSACNFFNSYVLSINNVPQGTYCSLYTQPWDKTYSTNYGQYRGSDYYSVSMSYGYTLAPQDQGHI